MSKQIYDEFTFLPVSREMKRQLRRKRDGLCFRCNQPIDIDVSTVFCEDHAIDSREKNRERAGATARYMICKSYRGE